MILKILLFLLVVLESVGFSSILLSKSSIVSSTELVVGHLILCAFVGVLGQMCLPAAYRRPAGPIAVFLMTLAFFIPLLGAIGVFTLVCMTCVMSSRSIDTSFKRISENSLVAIKKSMGFQIEAGSLRARLNATSAPISVRFNALGKLQEFQSSQVTSTLRNALHDEVDDVRLVAFGILDSKEKMINARINKELQCLESAAHQETKAQHCYQLACSYWELVYQDLVKGEVLAHALDQSKGYAETVLSYSPEDSGTWALLGQIHLRYQEIEAAQQAFMTALQYGVPENRVIPYLAEIMFYQRDFAKLRDFFSKGDHLEDVPLLEPVSQYWRSPYMV